jgi:hypothetical protein
LCGRSAPRNSSPQHIHLPPFHRSDHRVDLCLDKPRDITPFEVSVGDDALTAVHRTGNGHYLMGRLDKALERPMGHLQPTAPDRVRLPEQVDVLRHTGLYYYLPTVS